MTAAEIAEHVSYLIFFWFMGWLWGKVFYTLEVLWIEWMG